MIENTFTTLFNMSITASVAAILIIVFRWIFCNKLPKVLTYSLWMIVLLRLLIPFSFSSKFSIFNTIHLQKITTIQNQQYIKTTNNSCDIYYEKTPRKNFTSDKLNKPISDQNTPIKLNHLLSFIIIRVWLVGALSLCLFSIYIYRNELFRLKEAVLYKQNNLILDCSQKLKLNRKVEIYTSDKVNTPIVCGLVKII